jgi:hypothetical protein
MNEIEQAMWAGDTDRLHELAPCGCCCWEHFFAHCPAQVWDGCRGNWRGRIDADEWQKFYQQSRGMSYDMFYNGVR